VILFQIDPQSVAVFPLERDAPRPVDVNAVADGGFMQRMKLKPWEIHVLKNGGLVESVEAADASLSQVRRNLCTSACREQFV
jgi:hypothetical protein